MRFPWQKPAAASPGWIFRSRICGARDAARVLVPVQRLFWIERAINRRAKRDKLNRKQVRALRARVRKARSKRTLDEIYAAAGDLALKSSTLPKSKLGKALGYLDRQRDPLSVFLADSCIPIHNNDSERDLRHLAIGRNNWLVFASERGGDVACRLYSLILSCLQGGVNPQDYIEDLLTKISTTPRWAVCCPTGVGGCRVGLAN